MSKKLPRKEVLFLYFDLMLLAGKEGRNSLLVADEEVIVTFTQSKWSTEALSRISSYSESEGICQDASPWSSYLPQTCPHFRSPSTAWRDELSQSRWSARTKMICAKPNMPPQKIYIMTDHYSYLKHFKVIPDCKLIISGHNLAYNQSKQE